MPIHEKIKTELMQLSDPSHAKKNFKDSLKQAKESTEKETFFSVYVFQINGELRKSIGIFL